MAGTPFISQPAESVHCHCPVAGPSRSRDNWGQVTDSSNISENCDLILVFQVFATTGVAIHQDIYVLYAMLHVLFNPEAKEQVATFEIHKQTL